VGMGRDVVGKLVYSYSNLVWERYSVIVSACGSRSSSFSIGAAFERDTSIPAIENTYHSSIPQQRNIAVKSQTTTASH
jgi:hypothetical protein